MVKFNMLIFYIEFWESIGENIIMKIDTFKYFFSDAMKSLKRNITITIFSIITISAALFIVGLFSVYLLSVDKNYATIFADYKQIIVALKLLEVGVFIILPIISLMLVINAIKMAVFPRRDEISIMKLIGATNWFIRWPFIIEGGVIGITGAIVGNLSLFFIYTFVYSKTVKYIPELSLMQPNFVVNTLFLPFVIAGAFMGSIASTIALRKILKCDVLER